MKGRPIVLCTMLCTSASALQASEKSELEIENDSAQPEEVSAENDNAFTLPEILVSTRKMEAPAAIIVRQVSREDIDAWNAHTIEEYPALPAQACANSAPPAAWLLRR